MEATNKKRKLNVARDDYGTFCLCCNPGCDKAMKLLKHLNPGRHAYFDLPSNPKPVEELKNAPKPTKRRAREMKSQRRRRMLEALPDEATIRINDGRYSASTQFKIASLHFHDDIYNLCKGTDAKATLVDSIPSELALRLGRAGFEFTAADKFPDGSYVPLPNVPPRDIVAYGERLEKESKQAATAAAVTPNVRRTIPTRNSSIATPESIEISRLKDENRRLNAAHESEKRETELLRAALERRKKELDRQQTRQICTDRHDACVFCISLTC